MYINIEGLLYERKKSLSWLAKEVNIGYSQLWKIANNEVRLINLELFQRLCNTLECEVGEILILGERVE